MGDLEVGGAGRVPAGVRVSIGAGNGGNSRPSRSIRQTAGRGWRGALEPEFGRQPYTSPTPDRRSISSIIFTARANVCLRWIEQEPCGTLASERKALFILNAGLLARVIAMREILEKTVSEWGSSCLDKIIYN